jgi:hypothetical protein
MYGVSLQGRFTENGSKRISEVYFRFSGSKIGEMG